MRKIEKVVEKLVQRTEDGEIDWGQPNSTGHFEAEIEDKPVRIYQNGTISIDGWKHRSKLGVELYKSARKTNRPEFVDKFIDSVLQE